MADVHDVAKYILEQRGEMSTMKLQKLVYYSQAWSLVWDDTELFEDRIEAWANGPVMPVLYAQHRGKFSVSLWGSGDLLNLDEHQIDTIDAVLNHYGEMSPRDLSDRTHSEVPWQKAREGMSPGERGTREITQASMRDYYGSF